MTTPTTKQTRQEQMDAKLNELRSFVKGRVIGQDAAVDALCTQLIPGEMGFTEAGEPKSLVMICGPTGTGKTKAIIEASKYLCGTDVLCRIDVSEYNTEAAIPRLLGEGRKDPGVLGEQLALLERNGGRFILLDEIEKGHVKVADLLLGVEAARITLATGRTVDLSSYHIIATSNLGAKELSEAGDGVPERTRRRVVEDAAKQHFRPEVLARFAEIIMYKKLTQAAQVAICRQMLGEQLTHLEAQIAARFGHPHSITIGVGVFQRLVSEGYHRELGARPMRNVVRKRTRNAVAEALLKGSIFRGVQRSVLTLAGENGYSLVPARGAIRLVA